MTPPAIAGTAALVDLTPSERLVLWGARMWISGDCTGASVLPTMAAVFRQAMAVAVVPPLDMAMTLVTASLGGAAAFGAHSPDCPGMGGNERLLLDLLALHQCGEGVPALFLVRTLLPPAGARLAGPSLQALAMELLACGLRLPDRRGEAGPAGAGLSAGGQGTALHRWGGPSVGRA